MKNSIHLPSNDSTTYVQPQIVKGSAWINSHIFNWIENMFDAWYRMVISLVDIFHFHTWQTSKYVRENQLLDPIELKTTFDVQCSMPAVQYYYYQNWNNSICQIWGVSIWSCDMQFDLNSSNSGTLSCQHIEPFVSIEIIFKSFLRGNNMNFDICSIGKNSMKS